MMELHFTIDTHTATLLSDLALKHNKSLADFSRDIFLETLERQEDTQDLEYMIQYDTPNAKHIKHEDAWKLFIR